MNTIRNIDPAEIFLTIAVGALLAAVTIEAFLPALSSLI
jgi:hypothetical protein